MPGKRQLLLFPEPRTSALTNLSPLYEGMEKSGVAKYLFDQLLLIVSEMQFVVVAYKANSRNLSPA